MQKNLYTSPGANSILSKLKAVLTIQAVSQEAATTVLEVATSTPAESYNFIDKLKVGEPTFFSQIFTAVNFPPTLAVKLPPLA